MNSVDVNKMLVDSYLELLKNLNTNSKLDLISGLSNSLKSDRGIEKGSLKTLTVDFIPEKSADEIIDELKKSRNFFRNTESF
jgi:hypothetical protein